MIDIQLTGQLPLVDRDSDPRLFQALEIPRRDLGLNGAQLREWRAGADQEPRGW